MQDKARLTQLSHKGGCGCKIPPSLLRSMLSKSTPSFFPKELLVGNESSDDAAVYQINENQAIVATTDFFMPIVDDAFDFGCVAATNAISDVYAMGGTPLFALALVGMPMQTLPMSEIQNILAGGEQICSRAGIVIAGGHSIDSLEPMYGLCVIGMVNPKNVKRNTGAKSGDLLILGKPLGVGIYCSALKKQKLEDVSYKDLIRTMTQLNTPGLALSNLEGVHALTDVTGFGFLGHLLEVSESSNVGVKVDFKNLPFLPRTAEFAEMGFVTGASKSNWSSYSDKISNRDALSEVQRNVLTDPQTSGGLLLACSKDSVEKALQCFSDKGMKAFIVGEFQDSGVEIVL